VESALALLADTPVERVSMRRVARALDSRRPALLRHFRSRGDLLAAVLSHSREELARLAAKAVTGKQTPLASLERFAGLLAAHIERNPGLPRLLRHAAASGPGEPQRATANQLDSMQRALATELLRQARAAGELAGDVDPGRAASLLLALLQGLVLDWERSGRRDSLASKVAEGVAFWRAGVTAGEPAGAETGLSDAAAEKRSRGATRGLIALDVRPLLAAGEDPLEDILGQLDELAPDGVMKILAPFRPVPLLGLLTARGYRARAREWEAGCWGVEVTPPEAPVIEDLRELEAPLPLERVLDATAKLAAGQALAARVPRHPHLLLPHLEARGLAAQVYDEPDGSALLFVRRPA